MAAAAIPIIESVLPQLPGIFATIQGIFGKGHPSIVPTVVTALVSKIPQAAPGAPSNATPTVVSAITSAVTAHASQAADTPPAPSPIAPMSPSAPAPGIWAVALPGFSLPAGFTGTITIEAVGGKFTRYTVSME